MGREGWDKWVGWLGGKGEMRWEGRDGIGGMGREEWEGNNGMRRE